MPRKVHFHKRGWTTQQIEQLGYAKNPLPGDYWQEMFVPCAIVLSSTKHYVTVCRATKSVDAGHWTWDADKVERLHKNTWIEWLSYNSIPGFWCRCCRQSHLDWVKAYNDGRA